MKNLILDRKINLSLFILSVVTYKSHVILVITFLFFLVMAAFVLYISYYRRKRFYKRLYSQELELKSLKAHLEYIVKFSNDIILLEDEDWNIVEANERAVQAFQYSIYDLRKLNIIDLVAKKSGEFVEPKKLEIAEKDGMVFESINKRKDGTTFYAEGSAKIIEIDGKTFHHQIFRDITERKENKKVLRESEDRYRDLVENSSDLICTHDLDGKLLSVNKAAEKITGYAEKDLLKMNMQDIIVPEYQILFNAYLAKIKDTGKAVGLMTIQTKTGERRIWEYNNTLRSQGISNPIVRGMVKDITERRYAEEALRESEKRYRLIAEHTADTIALFDTNLNPIYVSASVLRLRGYTVQEAMTQQLDQILTPGSLQKVNKAFAEQMKLEQNGKADPSRTSILELEEYCKDGSTIWVELVASFLRDNNFKLTGIITVTRNITERKIAERVIVESEKRFKDLANLLPHTIFESDINGILTFVNETALTIFSYSLEDISKGIHIINMFSEKDKIEAIENIDRLLKGLPPSKNEYEIVRKDGSTFPALTFVSPIIQDGKSIGLRGTIVDITERKQAEEALRENELRLASIYETVGDVIFYIAVETDGQYRFVSVNPSFCRVTGLRFEQIVGKKVSEIIPEPSLTMVLGKYYHAIETKTIVCWEETSNYPTGQLIGEVTVSPVFNNSGKCTYLVGSVHDITERKFAEGALQQSEERFRSLYENSTMGIYRTTHDGQILLANPTLVKMLGFSSFEELAGRNLEKYGFKHTYERKQFIEQIETNGEVKGLEAAWTRNDGSTIYINESARAIRDSSGKTLYYDGTVEDITERKLAEEALRQSEERFRKIFEDHAAVKLLIDPDTGNIVDANKAAGEYYGWSRDELKQMNVRQINTLPFEEIKIEIENIRKHKKNLIEFRQRLKDGLIRDVEVYSSKIEIGGKDYLHSIIFDITQRKQIEEELQKLSLAVEQNPISILITDLNGKIEYVNPKFTETTGYTFEEAINQNPSILRSGSQTKDFYKNLWDTLLSGESWSGVLHNKKKNGELYWDSIIITPIKNNNGENTHFVGLQEDITDKVEKENELRKYREHLEELVEEKTKQLTKQNTFFRTLIDTIPNPVFVEDKEFRLTEVNKAYEEYFGKTRDMVLGKTTYDFVPVELANLEKQYDEQLLISYNTVVHESFIPNKEKGRTPVLFYKSSFGLPGKKPEGITALMIDISKQKEMEKITLEALKKEKELNEMKTNFISMASHEFRTPLTTILASADLLEMYHNKWEEVKNIVYFKKIQDSVQYITSLLDEVLTISRSDRGKIDFNPSVVNLNDFCSKIIEQIKLQASSNHNIIYDNKLHYQNIISDTKLLNHILSNLLINAVKFSPNGGDVILSVEDDNEFIKFTVKDNGIGIPKEDVNNLFEPFYRAKNIGDIKGTGLGLSIVKRYVGIHNGEISLDSQLGKGTKFFVKIKKEIKAS
ncbi:MAG: PAS domain S-box protein [Ignavibacteriaceae bacterium]